jgi:hypothetical protein
METLNDAAAARDDLDTGRQLALARGALESIAEPQNASFESVMVRGLELAVDALCNQGRAAEARRLAESKVDMLYEVSSQGKRRLLVRSPQSLVMYRAQRVLAHAIELAGDPDDAMHRSLGFEKRLSRSDWLEDAADIPASMRRDPLKERILLLRTALSSAKRSNSRVAFRFAEKSREQGDALATAAERIAPAEAASYWHRAACLKRCGSDQTEDIAAAAAMFAHSLPLRPDTARDKLSRGMAEGEILVLSGQRKAGARLMSRTVESFRGVLPRHEASAREQLQARGLLIA